MGSAVKSSPAFPVPSMQRSVVQIPAQFDYARAESVDHAIALLERYGPESRVVAGGHSLLPMMKLRLA
ncbi:MAG: FAD binding domain-containing protein, partial [Allobranchiibius sp.]